MTDYFTTLQEPRRPWLDAEALKAKFLALSPAAHPDHANNDRERGAAEHRFAELNAAFTCLREPRTRLQHLLALETGQDARQVRQVPPAVAELILPVEQLCREATAFLTRRAAATSPLIQARLFAEAIEWTEKISAAKQRLQAFQARLDEEAAAMNSAWAAADGLPVNRREEALPLARLGELYRAYSYTGRFEQQLQERLVQLAV